MTVYDSLEIATPISVRDVKEQDLAKLEWFGLLSQFRDTIRRTYDRVLRGEVVYVVADLKGFPVGQVQIDFAKHETISIAVIWAFRVLPALQNLGIGSQLMYTAEHIIRQRGYSIAELAVEADNPDARRLYERLGYEVVRENTEQWCYTSPDGETHEVVQDEWVMHKVL